MMEFGYVIRLMLLAISLISMVIIYGLKRNQLYLFKGMLFFFFCYYFLLSAVKWFLGSPENTLVESFWDAVPRTYIHYGIPITVIGIVAPIIFKKLFGKVMDKLIGLLDACMLIGLFSAFLIKGIIDNRVYCIAFAASALIALGITFLYKKDVLYLSAGEYRKQILEVLPAVVILTFMSGIYYPNELYLNNLDEFINPFGGFFLILLTGSLLSAVIMIMGMLLLPKSWIRPCNLVLLGIGIMGYLQAMFLNGKLNSLTGDTQIWGSGKQIINVVIWIAVVCLVVGLGYYKAFFQKIFKGICIYICLIQLVTLVTLVVTTDVTSKGSQEALTTQGSLELSDGNNVLVFILDMFDSSVLQQIIEEDSSFVEPLADFTFYRNTTSCFSHTMVSIPYLLTGTEWTPGITTSDYPVYAYENSNTLWDIEERDYNVGVYTNVNYLSDSVYEAVANYSDEVKVKCKITDTYSTMRRTAMYTLVPFCLKQNYAYYTSDIRNMIDADEIWSIENDLPFYNSLIKTGLSINNEHDNAFRFYHMRGDHEPFYLSEDLQYDKTGRENNIYSQARGSLKIVYEYLKQLKELGKYDDATIIITADHGKIINYDSENNRPDEPTMPIMLVKEPNQTNNSLMISDAPVSQTEIMPYVMKQIGLDWKLYGKTFDEIPVNEERQRYYYAITMNGYELRFSILGNANKIENWSVAE